MWTRRFFVAIGFALLATACGGGDSSGFEEGALPQWANRDLSVGRERVLVAVVGANGRRLASPDVPAVLEVAPADDLSAVQSRDAGFTWSVPGAVGFYRAVFDFDRPGIWELTVRSKGGAALDTVLIQVQDDQCRRPGADAPCAPRVGEPAPSLATPTSRVSSLAELSSDSDPDPRLYELSLDELIANGRTGVVIFATPAFCQTSACGPIVDNIKPIVADHPNVDFLHIEVYTGLLDDDFVPDFGHLAPAMIEWTLATEPWVFVIDGQGSIVARFEGVLDPSELMPHL